MTKKIFAFLIILSLFAAPLAQEAQAGILDDIKNGGICFGAGWLANWITDKIADKAKDAFENLIGGVIGDEVPVRDNPVRRDLAKQTTKERNLDLIARCVARTFFDKEIFGILNVAKKRGRDGGPLHIRNWRNFQTNAQYRGEGIFRAILANTQLCDYLAKDVKNTFGVTAKDKVALKGQNIRVGDFDPFTLRAKCTLPSNFDLTKYQKDFAGNGGWAAFNRLLEPQNNPYGLALAALDEANKQKALEISADVNQVQANNGYLGVSGNTAQDSCLAPDANGKCLFYKNIKAPGYYIAANIAATVNQELGWLTNADELNEVIVTVSTRLANRILTFDQDEKLPTYDGDLTGSVAPTVLPTGSPPPNSCTGGNPACRCVTEDSGYAKYSDALFEAEDRAAVARPDLIDSSGSAYKVRPGVSNTTVLTAICASFTMPGVTCRPHRTLDDEVVLEVASPREDVAVDVITSNGFLWANPTAACQPGVH